MANFLTKDEYKSYYIPENGGGKLLSLKKQIFDPFDPLVLGLGDIDQKANPVETLAVVFDLSGFTNFCKQIDPHLAVPQFLNGFIEWLFNKIKEEVVDRVTEHEVIMYCPLPYFTKFLGDGLLILWDMTLIENTYLLNTIMSCYNICVDYRNEFYPKIKRKFSDAPMVLRCGIARGTVFSVGNSGDYIGSCINMASRLQKINGATFAFSTRGINTDEDFNDFQSLFIYKRVEIRGIGQDEIVGIMGLEYEALHADDKSLFLPLE